MVAQLYGSNYHPAVTMSFRRLAIQFLKYTSKMSCFSWKRADYIYRR